MSMSTFGCTPLTRAAGPVPMVKAWTLKLFRAWAVDYAVKLVRMVTQAILNLMLHFSVGMQLSTWALI